MNLLDAIFGLFSDEETKRRRHELAIAGAATDETPFAFGLPWNGKGYSQGKQTGDSGVSYDNVQDFLTSIIAAANERQGYIPAGLREAAANSPMGLGYGGYDTTGGGDAGGGDAGGGAPTDTGVGGFFDVAPAAAPAPLFGNAGHPPGYVTPLPQRTYYTPAPVATADPNVFRVPGTNVKLT